jgi:Rab-GTPase-TBC domain
MLVRLLDAFVWRNHGNPHPHSIASDAHLKRLIDRQESSQQLGFTYVQGMNVLAAPFLYTMPSELEAFFCFSKFIEESCPLYVQPTLEGVHRGLRVSIRTIDSLRLLTRSEQLLDRCLKIVDPELFNYLRSKNLSAELYAFPCEYSRPCPAIVILSPSVQLSLLFVLAHRHLTKFSSSGTSFWPLECTLTSCASLHNYFSSETTLWPRLRTSFCLVPYPNFSSCRSQTYASSTHLPAARGAPRHRHRCHPRPRSPSRVIRRAREAPI